MKIHSTLLLGLLTHFLAAQSDTTQSQALDEVIVSAFRSPAERFAIPEATHLITPKMLANPLNRTAPEALMRTTGVWVQKTNHGGGSPFVRGLTGNQVLLLIDGIRLNNATFRFGPNQYFNTIDVFGLSRIEVLHGSGSVQYGSDAFGGAIQVLTRELAFTDRWSTHGRILGRLVSRDMEQSGRAEIQIAGPKAAFSGGWTQRRFGTLYGGKNTGPQVPSAYREGAFDLKAKFLLAPKLTLTAAHQQLTQFDVPVYHKVTLEDFALNEFDPQHRSLSYLRTNWTPDNRVWKDISLTLAGQFTREGRNSQKNNADILRKEEDRVSTFAIILQSETRISDQITGRHGVEVYHDRVNSDREDENLATGIIAAKRGLYPDGSTMTSYALFSLYEWQMKRLTLSGGLRWNGYRIEAKDTENQAAVLTPDAMVGNAGILYRLREKLGLFASYNSAFRTPNIDDLGALGIVDFRYEVPNFDLKPERSHNFQAGMRYRAERLRFELALFRNEIRDLITRVQQDTQTIQGYPVYLKVNAGEAYIQGLESDVRCQFTPNLSLEGGLAYAFGHNLSAREPMRRIPPLNGRIAVLGAFGNLILGAEMLSAALQDRLAAGDVADNRIPEGGTPGWTVFNVNASYTWKKMNLELGWQNIGNKDYRYHGSGINAAGSSILATLSFNW